MQSPLLKKRFWRKKILFEKLWIQVLRNLGESFLFLPTKLRQACQNFVVFVQTIILTNRFFGKLVKFSSFPKFSGIWRENFGRVVTTAFWVSRWLLRKNSLVRKKRIAIFLGREGKDSPCFWRHGYGKLVKNSLYMFRRRFLQRNFLEGLLFFPHFQKSSKKFSEFWRENFGRVVTTTFIHVHRNILRIFFIISKKSWLFRRFWNLRCKCVDSQRKLFATVVKIAFSVAKESYLMKKKIVQKIVTSTILEFGNVFRFFGNKVTPGLPKLLVHVRRTFLGETTLLGKRTTFSSIPEFEQNVFIILTGTFGQGGHNRILRDQMKFFLFLKERSEGKNTSFWKFRIAIIFRLWAKKIFSTFAGMVTAGLSKIRCTCSDEVFTKKFFESLINFSSFPELQPKVFRILTRKFRQSGHNYFYTCT